MINTHLFIPVPLINNIKLLEDHNQWLEKWLEDVDKQLLLGCITSATCLQGLLYEKIYYKQLQRDWLEIMDELLIDKYNNPLAYSEAYGKKLYNYTQQWLQTPVHAIHTKWWIDNFCNANATDNAFYSKKIEECIQTNGWIYDPKSSETIVRNRMRSELTMSLAMGTEILLSANNLEKYKDIFIATLCEESLTNYISAEYFRAIALENLNAENQAPVGIDGVIEKCITEYGFADFSVYDKRDEYMGTLNRVSRDKVIHSAISCIQANYLTKYCSASKIKIETQVKKFVGYIKEKPTDFPSFKIRDLADIPFGTGISPLELICASALCSNQ